MPTVPIRIRTCARFAAVLMSLCLFAGAASAAPGPAGRWTQISPPSQSGGAAAFDPSRNAMYVFGGDGQGVVHVATATPPPVEWSVLSTTNVGPGPRTGCGVVYDQTADRLLIFGGIDPASHLHSDVWQLPLAGPTYTWSQVAVSAGGPKPRRFAAVAYSSLNSALLVFGGRDSTSGPAPNTTYVLDASQDPAIWTAIAPTPSTPVAGYSISAVSDENHTQAILFGGTNGATFDSSVHTFSFATRTWSAHATSGDDPGGRSDALAMYDYEDEMLLLWGGTNSDDEVRSLSLSSGVWTIRPNQNWQASPTGHTYPVGAWLPGQGMALVLDGDSGNNLFEFLFTPANSTSYWQNWLDPGASDELRSSATFVYDKTYDRAFLFGGQSAAETALNSTWSYTFSDRHGWTDDWFWNWVDDPRPGLFGHSAVWDDAHNRMVIFGGTTTPSYTLSSTVYTYVDSAYGLFAPGLIHTAGTAPSARTFSSAIYDPVGQRMIVFGGLEQGGSCRGDVWQLTLPSVGTPTWSQLHPAGPRPNARLDHTAIYDAVRRSMILFGGTDSLSGSSDNDVWSLDLASMTWTHLLPTGTLPPGRYQHTAVYDSRRERMLVLGGQVISGDARDVWSLDLSTSPPAWTKLAPPATPEGIPANRYRHAAVYDRTNDRMVVYGGLIPPFSIFGNPFPLKDLWSLQFDKSGTTVGVAPATHVAAFTMSAPSPNPARSSTRIAFTLGHDARVRAEVFDVSGRRVNTLIDGIEAAGEHTLEWSGHDANGGSVRAGLYLCRLSAGDQSLTQKIMWVR